MSNQLLSILILVPLFGAVGALFVPRQAPKALRRLTTLFLLAEVGLSILPFIQGAPGLVQGSSGAGRIAGAEAKKVASGLLYEQKVAWVKELGVFYHVGADMLSLWLILLTSVLCCLGFVALTRTRSARIKETAASFLMLEAALVGAFCSQNLVLFYVFFELSLIPTLILVGIWGGEFRIRAARRFFVYTACGSLALLAGLLFLGFQQYQATGSYNYGFAELAETSLSVETERWIFLAFMFAFAIKTPLFPFHTWQSDLYKESPAAFTAVIAALLSKLGVYGMVRIALPTFPLATAFFAPTVALLAVLSIFHGSLCAWVQRDLKRLLAYSSLAHLGVLVLGVFSVTQAGIAGAGFFMVAHGVVTAGLFFLLAFLETHFGTTDLRKLGGLSESLPWFATLFVMLSMANVGLPGLCGFVAEFMVFSGTLRSSVLSPWAVSFCAASILSVFLSALYMLRAVRHLCFGPLKQPLGAGDVSPVDGPSGGQRTFLGAASVLAFAALLLGLAPTIVTIGTTDSARATIETFRKRLERELERPEVRGGAAATIEAPAAQPSGLGAAVNDSALREGERR